MPEPVGRTPRAARCDAICIRLLDHLAEHRDTYGILTATFSLHDTEMPGFGMAATLITMMVERARMTGWDCRSVWSHRDHTYMLFNYTAP